jgi:CIC family chloride channel protein
LKAALFRGRRISKESEITHRRTTANFLTIGHGGMILLLMMTKLFMQRYNRYHWSVKQLVDLLLKLPERPRAICKTCAYGFVAGLVAVAFQLAMNGCFHAGIVRLSHGSFPLFLWGSLGLILGTSLISGWLLNSYCAEAAGSGIPQLKAAFWKDFGFVPFRVLWVKFIAATLQIGGGSSLGREGPSVQLAGAGASLLAGMVGEPKQKRRLAAATGAAAGLAAAFNTPLAGVTFVLEELIGDLNSRLLGSVLLGAMLGALVAHGIIGPQPSFSLAAIGEPTWRSYLLVPIVAAAGTLVGVAFQKSAIGLRARQKKWHSLPAWLRPSLGALVCWALGVTVFVQTGKLGVFGLGYDDLSEALTGKLLWQTAAWLLAAKFIATVACYGMGGCGGIFSPTLFFGAMTGLGLAGVAQPIFSLSPDGVAMLTVVCMSATLGAVVRAPVTGILIVFEMTHQFSLVPPLMLAALVSQAVSRRLARRNFYDALLEQDGHVVDRFSPPRNLREWQKQPISLLANPKPVAVISLEPKDLQALLQNHPYNQFPALIDGQIRGVLTREEAARAIREKRPPVLVEGTVCHPDATLRDVETRLIESKTGFLLLQNQPGEPLTGILTLHDILRAQQAAAEEGYA